MKGVTEQELQELRLEAAGARRREASLKDAHAARIAQLEREIQKLKPAALYAKDLEARLADREQRVQKLRAEVASVRRCMRWLLVSCYREPLRRPLFWLSQYFT